MNNSSSVLGKGLSSLIPNLRGGSVPPASVPASAPKKEADVIASASGEQVIKIPVANIVANPWQPRSEFDQEHLAELSRSVAEHGIIQPLVVTRLDGDHYQLIAGERRLKAAKLAGLAAVPAIVRTAADQEKLELSLVENIQRHDLNAIEQAKSYKRLMDEFHLTQEEVAAKVGKSRSAVANYLRLLNLPMKIQAAVSGGSITFSHAKIILSYATLEEQLQVFEKVLKQNLTVAQIQQSSTIAVAADERRKADPVLQSWEEKLSGALGFPAHIKKTPAGGQVEIGFTTEEDLKALLDKLLGPGI